MRGHPRVLLLFISGTLAGHVLQDDDGALSFAYEPSYSGPPVSLSMRVAPVTYPQRFIRPYLQGLLPDDPVVRADIANQYGCSGENPFALLSHIGLDCPGAVQLVTEDAVDLIESRPHNLVELKDAEIEERLRLSCSSITAATSAYVRLVSLSLTAARTLGQGFISRRARLRLLDEHGWSRSVAAQDLRKSPYSSTTNKKRIA